MRLLIIFVSIAVAFYAGYEYIRITRLVKISANLVKEARPFERAEGVRNALILGDSTAVGVGADSPEDSVAGRLSEFFDARIENYAQSGATIADMGTQLSKATQTTYDLILIQVGANDVIRFHSLSEAERELDSFLENAATHSKRTVLLTGGRIGEASFFPRIVSFVWTFRANALRVRFIEIAKKYDTSYVDLYNTADPFMSDPLRYYASDGLHLTGDGYEFWFEEIRKTIENRWPEFAHGSE